jgi:hypothetical protein
MIKKWQHLIRACRFVYHLFLVELFVSNAFFATVQINPRRSGTGASRLLRNFLLLHRSRKNLIPQPMQMMIRNIDLPEAVVLYGTKIVLPSFATNKSDEDAIQQFCDVDTQILQVRKGLEKFIGECHDIKAVVVVLLDSRNDDMVSVSAERNNDQIIFLEKVLAKELFKRCHVHVQTVAPPNPTDLIAIANNISVQPRPYGGSATIGYSRAADPERLLDPKHCVVFTSAIDQTRIARALGMRVVSFNSNDDLADAVLMNYDDIDNRHVSMHISVDDIATPGSFWLNPPHPRDDFGNRVNDAFETLLNSQATMITDQDKNVNQVESNVDYNDDDSSFKAMLNDITPLYD